MNGFLPYLVSRRLEPTDLPVNASRDWTGIGADALVVQLPPLAGLIIDPENVLYDATGWRRWLFQLLGRMGVSTTFSEFFEPWEVRFRKDVDLGRCDFGSAFSAFLADVGLSEGQIAEIISAGLCRIERFEAEARCLTGVKETLARLVASGIPLYAFLHAPQPSADAARNLERLGLRNLIAGVLTSGDMGCVMPATEAYRGMLERFCLRAEQTVLVASQARRLRGAIRCGISTVAVNSDRETTADFSLEQFSDLLRIVPPATRALRAG